MFDHVLYQPMVRYSQDDFTLASVTEKPLSYAAHTQVDPMNFVLLLSFREWPTLTKWSRGYGTQRLI